MKFGLLNVRKGLLQPLLPALRRLPPRAALRLVGLLGRAEYHLNLPMRLRFDDAIRDASAHFAAGWNPRRLGADLAASHLQWRARDLLLDGLPDDKAGRLFRVIGRDRLDAALAGSEGVVLLFNHFGTFLMPAHWLIRNGYPLRWFTERPRHVSKLMDRSFATDGPLGQDKLFMSRKAGPAEGGTAFRRAVSILRAGMIVQVAGDVRGTGPRTVAASFLGQTYTFTTTWVTLAARSGSPVVPAFGRIDRDGNYAVEFLAPFRVPSSVTKTGDYGPWVQDYLRVIEDRVRSYPCNSGDYFFWSGSRDYRATPAAQAG